MNRKTLWLVVSGFMVLSLVLTACGPAETAPTTPTAPPTAPTTPTTPTAPVTEKPQQEVVKPTVEVPKYGGTLTLSLGGDITAFDPQLNKGMSGPICLTNQRLWSGDWTKGPAGGYGTNETDWRGRYDLFDLKMGYIAESTKWTVDEAKDEGTIVYQIRQGVKYALDPKNEASRLVNGREVTADDVVFGLKRAISDPNSFIYRANPELRTAVITKSGPREVTVKVKLASVVQVLSRFGEATNVAPAEVVQKYGDMNDWKKSVGTGPFILTDYVAGSLATLVRNPNYWMTDPIGPGKGNQLPYLDSVKLLIIPDASTRQAALRTAKVDMMGGDSGLSWEDAEQMRKTAPALKEIEGEMGAMPATYFNTTRVPFNNVKVRRAIMMATDLEAVRQSLNHGLGQILTFPFEYSKTYAELYLGLDDPEMPASVKELYTYNPEKARQLLKEAGYPNGFKTSILITSSYVDYYSIMKDMWAKVGIELTLDVKESGVVNNLMSNRNYDMATGGKAPVGIFYLLSNLTGEATTNGSVVNDPIINAGITEVRRACITDLHAGMRLFKELMKYTLDQAYAIPRPGYPLSNFWWPWIKNYTGETSVGFESIPSWTQWVWLDQDLKKSTGH